MQLPAHSRRRAHAHHLPREGRLTVANRSVFTGDKTFSAQWSTMRSHMSHSTRDAIGALTIARLS